jgi:hypothetical protein
MEQTAVEWLVEQMKLDELFNADYFIQQAKEMEKQQIMDAYIDRTDCTDKEEMRKIMGGQYYNKTYSEGREGAASE